MIIMFLQKRDHTDFGDMLPSDKCVVEILLYIFNVFHSNWINGYIGDNSNKKLRIFIADEILVWLDYPLSFPPISP